MTDFAITTATRSPFPGAAMFKAVALWAETARERKALRGMSYSQLEDLGLSPRDADAEAARPFWDVASRR